MAGAPLFIVAKDRDDARRWEQQVGLSNHPTYQCIFIDHPDRVQGVIRPLVAVLSGWWRHPECEEISIVLKVREAVLLSGSL